MPWSADGRILSVCGLCGRSGNVLQTSLVSEVLFGPECHALCDECLEPNLPAFEREYRRQTRLQWGIDAALEETPPLEALIPALPSHAQLAGLLLLQTVHEGGTLYLFGPRCDLLNLMIAGCFSSLWDEEQETGLHIPEARSLAGTLFGKHPEQARKLLAARLLCLELHTLSLRMTGRLLQHLYEARRRNMISGLLLLVSPYTPESLRDQLLETFKDGGFTIVRAFISLVGKRCVSLYGGLEPELTLDSRHEGSVRWSGEP